MRWIDLIIYIFQKIILKSQAIFEGTFEEASNQLAKNQVYITKTKKVYFID